MIDGILAESNRLLSRNPDGTPKAGSVALRLTTRMPCHAAHMQMAVGGQDPEAPRRSYGEESTGILGRALFDYRNATPNENNAGTSPGLGVFVGELFLYEGKIFKDLYPNYVTSFGRTFRVLSPQMGGPVSPDPMVAVAVVDPSRSSLVWVSVGVPRVPMPSLPPPSSSLLAPPQAHAKSRLELPSLCK